MNSKINHYQKIKPKKLRSTRAVMTIATRNLIYGRMAPPNDIIIISEKEKEENYHNAPYYRKQEDV